jgi:hypothetical protein
MSTVLESITKKVEELGVGQVAEYKLGNETNDYNVIELSDPRDYKEFFRLDDLGVVKSLKSCVIEVKDSECKIYYLLDSSLISISLSCKWQPIEVIKELPIVSIAFFRILSAKKAPIELNIYEDKIHVIFEDTIPKSQSLKTLLEISPDMTVSGLNEIIDTTQKKRQKKEKPVAKKYILEIPLSDLRDFDKAVLDFVDNLDIETNYEFVEIFEIPISVKDYDPQFNVYKTTSTTYGDFKSVNVNCNSGLLIRVIECPILVGKNFSKEKFIVKENVSEEIESDDELLLVEEEIDND